jgi:hypothetical protein
VVHDQVQEDIYTRLAEGDKSIGARVRIDDGLQTDFRFVEFERRAGGARGEVARGTAEDCEMAKGPTSSRLVSGTMAITGDCAATTEAAVEQTGQT